MNLHLPKSNPTLSQLKITNHFTGNRPFIKVRINGYCVNALLDTGSHYSVMSLDLAIMAKVNLQKSDLEIESAFSKRYICIGICDFNFEFQNTKRVNLCQVFTNTSCPLILGSLFMTDCRLNIFMGSRSVSYEDFKTNKLYEINCNKPFFDFKTDIDKNIRSRYKTNDKDNNNSEFNNQTYSEKL